jgi:hypothetical protein
LDLVPDFVGEHHTRGGEAHTRGVESGEELRIEVDVAEATVRYGVSLDAWLIGAEHARCHITAPKLVDVTHF